MDTLLNLRAFLASVRYGSFSAAARQVHVVPSVIAKRVSELEHLTQTRLFLRTTRSLELTEAGRKFHSHASALVAEFDAVVGSMKRAEGALEGHLRVKLPTTLAVMYLAELVSQFQSEHERITMEVVLVDRSINPVDENYDIAVTGLEESYEGVVDIPLCPLARAVYGAPRYLARKPAPAHPRELADHDCLVFKPQGATWQFESSRGPISVDVTQKLVTNDNVLLFTSVCAGNGLGVLPAYLVAGHPQGHTLQTVLDEFPLHATWLKALVPKRREPLPHVAAFVEWLKSRLGEAPPWAAA
ncbi:LysR family transcriptional regulator [Pandoraea pulmonicola]|uniref:D-malate degradation protein R n=1 Tax=Pandoraea pulmonicola TaxID=93221 RepID=A0AAJ5D024_PANPU|nr:LysR family transcriptional regulator [Pandoraea pulmonicola]AJC21039.1 transcriptional regulator [Pandoraea pulmonicola]SUA90321.1 D-malate degradation protein R [Pandoraea pulmonicola]